MPEDIQIGSAYIDIQARDNTQAGISKALENAKQAEGMPAALSKQLGLGIFANRETAKSPLEAHAEKLRDALKPIQIREEILGLQRELAKSTTVWGRFSAEFTRSQMLMSAVGVGALYGAAARFGGQQLQNAAIASPMFGLRAEQAQKDLQGIQGRWALNELELKTRQDQEAAQGLEFLRTKEGAAKHPVRSFVASAIDDFSAGIKFAFGGGAWRQLMYGDLAKEADKAGIKTTGAGGLIGAGQQFSGDDLFNALQSIVLQSPVNMGPQ